MHGDLNSEFREQEDRESRLKNARVGRGISSSNDGSSFNLTLQAGNYTELLDSNLLHVSQYVCSFCRSTWFARLGR
jgi:hypothetical protein